MNHYLVEYLRKSHGYVAGRRIVISASSQSAVDSLRAVIPDAIVQKVSLLTDMNGEWN
jgi:hypothetical protein